MGRRNHSKKNRQNGIRPAKQHKAGRPYSKAAIRERVLQRFHKEHVQVGEYPNTRWVSIDEEE
jgi:hypothetical protein